MTPRRKGRTQRCSTAEARRREVHARRFLEVAEIAADEQGEDPEYAGVAAALAVLAGVAASDAVCCKALGERSRSENHHDAEALLMRVRPGGGEAAKSLERLINLKNAAHYGFFGVSGQQLRTALRQARSLLTFAEEVFRR